MAIEVLPSAELARAWWGAHEPGGIFADAAAAYSVDEIDDAQDMENLVAAFSQSPHHLGQMIEQLVATVPRPERLSFIGTWHLENGYQVLGDRVFEILDATDLSDEIKSAILAGFVR